MTWSRKLTLGALLIAVALGLFEWATWPDAAKLARDNPETTAFIRSYENARQRQGREGHDAAADWRWVPYDRISRHLMRAVLVAEDINFFSHGGFETRELKLALAETIREGKPLRGASTLSQQLVKNLWLTPSRNPWRKVKEALITSQLERELTKRRILELYLNHDGSPRCAGRAFGCSVLLHAGRLRACHLFLDAAHPVRVGRTSRDRARHADAGARARRVVLVGPA